jgi:hypothetical protein
MFSPEERNVLELVAVFYFPFKSKRKKNNLSDSLTVEILSMKKAVIKADMH